MKVKILEKKIKGKTADLFYEQPYEATTKDGVTFYVSFAGEVRFDFKGSTYYENTLQKLFSDPDFDDDTISDMEFDNNGWLEINYRDTDNESLNQELMDFVDERDIAGDYDQGLDMLKRIAKEWERGR